MANIQSFKIDNSLAFVADGFDAQFAGSDVFINASDSETVTLNVGFYDDNGSSQFTPKITNGLIDEYTLNVTPSEITTTVTGRDQAALIVDRILRYRFVYQLAPHGSLPPGAPPPRITEVIGIFTAQQIASYLANIEGFGLAWLAPDYTFLETFEAVGRISEIFQKLIEPWNQVEPYKIDIYLENGIIVVKQRNGFSLSPQHTYSIQQCRIKSLSVTRRKLPIWGLITLFGAKKFLLDGGGGQGFQNTREISSPPRDPGSGAVAITGTDFDASGNRLDYEKVTVFLQPSGVESTYTATIYQNGSILKQEKRENVWQTSNVQGAPGSNSNPQQLSTTSNVWQNVVTATNDQGKPTQTGFLNTNKEETVWGNDSDGNIITKETRKYELQVTDISTNSRDLVLVSVEMHTYTNPAPDRVQEIKDVYTYDADQKKLFLSNTETSLSPGQRLKGATSNSRGGTRDPDFSFTGELVNSKLEVLIDSSDKRARDVQFTNNNITEEQLQLIMSWYKQSSGKFEYEINFVSTGMPFIKKGDVLQLTGLTLENGSSYSFLPALILEAKTTFIAAGQYASEVKAIYWS